MTHHSSFRTPDVRTHHSSFRTHHSNYPAYKDSGVKWLGEVPEHWEVVALKRLGDFQAGAGFPDSEQGQTEGEIPFYKVSDMNLPGNELLMRACNNAVSRETARRLRAFVFPVEAIVFAKVGAALLLNKRRIVSRPSCIDNNMMGFTRRSCDLMWAMYFMRNLDLGELANPGAVPSINEGQIREIRVPVPSLPEQRAIAAFLDRETRRIDTMVEKKRRQIELLREKRSALISHAVTKGLPAAAAVQAGLDPNVPMKDSGVEWLGEVPGHWEVRRIKHLASKIGSGKTPRGGAENYISSGIALLRSQNVHFGGLRLDDVVFIDPETDEEMRSTRVQGGDVLLNITGASLGRCCQVGNELKSGNVNQHVCIIRVRPDTVLPEYLCASICSRFGQSQIFANENGTSREGLSFPQVGMFVVLLPPLPEQRAIATFLDRETGRIDTLVGKVEESISTLQEYRSALISAAVTGKIDVRGEVGRTTEYPAAEAMPLPLAAEERAPYATAPKKKLRNRLHKVSDFDTLST